MGFLERWMCSLYMQQRVFLFLLDCLVGKILVLETEVGRATGMAVVAFSISIRATVQLL